MSEPTASTDRDHDPSIPRRRSDLYAVTLLVLLTSLFFIDVLAGSNRFYFRDLARFYYPAKLTLARIVASGEFPWWNPLYAGGQPMAANPEYCVFYPLQWLILLPDFDLGFRLHILVHLYIGVIGMYALLRSLGLRIPSSLYGAIAWGLGGVVLSNVNLLPILFAASWLPLILFLVRRALITRSVRWIALAALVAGVQILVGEPVTLIQTWLMVGAVLAWDVLNRLKRAEGTVRSWTVLGGIFLLAIAIGSAQLVPAIDLAGDTVRSRGLSIDSITYWSFPPQRIVEMVYPFVLGFSNDDGRQLWWGGPLYDREHSPFFLSVYAGALIVPLVLAGLFSRGTRRWMYLLASLPFFVLAVGDSLPLLEWLVRAGFDVPLRYPEKMMLGFVFGTVVYAAFVLDRGLSEDRRLLVKSTWFTAFFLLTASVLWIASRTGMADDFLGVWGIRSSMFFDRMKELVVRGWWIATVFLSVSLIILTGLRRGTSRRLWEGILIAALSCELLVVSLDITHRIDRALYDPPAILNQLPEDGDRWRIFHEASWYGRRLIPNGRGVYWEYVNGLYPLTPATWGLATVLERDYDRTQLLPTVELVESMWEVRNRGQEAWAGIFMRMSNARIRLAPRERLPESIWRLLQTDPWLIEPVDVVDHGPSPRYYFASEIRKIDGPAAFVESLVREVPPERVAFVQDLKPFKPAEGTIESVRETSSRVALETRSNGMGFLVLSMTPHKYWRATIDGEPAALVRTNVGYQGIVVGPGDHEIVLTYRNPLIAATAPVSIFFVLATLIALAWRGSAESR